MSKRNSKGLVKPKAKIRRISEEELRLEAYMFLKDYRGMIASVTKMMKELDPIFKTFLKQAKKVR